MVKKCFILLQAIMQKELRLHYLEQEYKDLESQLLDKKFNWDCWGIQELNEELDRVEQSVRDILRTITIH